MNEEMELEALKIVSNLLNRYNIFETIALLSKSTSLLAEKTLLRTEKEEE